MPFDRKLPFKKSRIEQSSQFRNSDLLSKNKISSVFCTIKYIFLAGVKAQITKLQIEEINQEKVSTPEQEQLLKDWADKIVKEMRIFVLNEYGIDLGNLDLTTGFEYVIMPRGFMQGSPAYTFSQGEIANNYFVFNDRLPLDFDNTNEQSVDDFVNLFLSVLIHEILHKLFNLHNRYNPVLKLNITHERVRTEFCEAIVEFFTGIITNGISQKLLGENTKKFSINQIWSQSELYNQYIQENILNFITQILAKSSSPEILSNPNVNPEFKNISSKEVVVLLADFFFSGSSQVDNLIKELDLPSILENIRLK